MTDHINITMIYFFHSHNGVDRNHLNVAYQIRDTAGHNPTGHHQVKQVPPKLHFFLNECT